MNYEELKDFVTNKMQMQHIYQPVMIKTLLESDNKTSVRKIAQAFLEKDESQIEYYEQITKIMPGKVLKKHNIIDYDSGSFSLNISNLTTEQRDKLIELCNQKIKEYQDFRGKSIWKHRARDSRLVPGSLRYQILTKAKHKCELCGISADEKALDVDHIIPVNKGGKTVICYTCNSQKQDRDDTDFRNWQNMYENRDKNCAFCNLEQSAKIANSLAFSFEDKYPVTKYHTLVCPRRHVDSFFELGSSEQKSILNLLEELKNKIKEKDKSVLGFNVGINDGKEAGQTVFHCHIHLIPRRKGDVTDPRGGVRNIIPGKGTYD